VHHKKAILYIVAGLTRYTRDGRQKEVATPRADSKDEQWKHVVYVFEGLRKPSRMYVDGKKVSEDYFSIWYVAPAKKMTIGNGFSLDLIWLAMGW